MDNNELLQRQVPYSLDAERSVIGSVLVDPAKISTIGDVLHPDDFYSNKYGSMYTALKEMYDAGKAIDLVTFQEKLISMGLPESITDVESMSEIANQVVVSANIKQYAEIVADKALRRRLIKASEEVADLCYKGGIEDTMAILSDVEKKMFGLVHSAGSADYVPIKEVVINAIKKIEETGKAGKRVTGLATGFVDLDIQTAGMQPSDLIIVAARPSMGKTAFVLNIAEHMAFREDKTVAIFSLEMSKEQLMNRLFALETGISSQSIRTGQLNETEWSRLMESAGGISKSHLIIDDTSGIKVSELVSKCRKFKLEHNLSCVIIDYIQLMSPDRATDGNKQQEVAEISRQLKMLARELNVPVIALSQLSRAVEKRDDKRPMLSDLRESGGIEQDADVVMFIYRDDYYNNETSTEKGIAEIIIAKQRNGPIGTIKLAWLADLTKFANSTKRPKDGTED